MHSGPRGGARPGAWLFFAAGEAVFLGILVLPDARRHLAAYLLLFLAGSLLSPFAARSLSGSSSRVLLLCATAFRLTLLFRAPDLSGDVFRYVWDGRIAAAGTSPYAFAPADAPDGLFPELRRRLAYPEYRTIYPPVAEAAFRIAASFPGSGVLPTKALFALADVGVVAILLASGGAGARFGAALYAFHPLPVTEVAGQGHLDSLGVALLLATVVFVSRSSPIAGGVTFALAALAKWVPLAATLPLLRRGRLRFAAAALAAGSLVWILAARGGVSPAVGLGPFATRAEFNSVLYPAVAAAVDSADLPARAKAAYMRWKDAREYRPWMQEPFPYFYTAFFARAILGIAVAIALIAIAAMVKDRELAVLASVASLLFVSPALHPWYLLWVLPFAAKRRLPSFLYLAAVAPLAYGLLYPLAGLTPAAIRALEYGPFAALLVWSFSRRAVRSPEVSPHPPGEGSCEGAA